MMRALGAEVILVDQSAGAIPGEVSGADLRRVEDEAARLAAARGAFRADQFTLAGNRTAHYFGTAPEIWAQSEGAVTAFCDFAGSAGTLAGVAKFFQQVAPQVSCYAIEPEGAAAIAGGDTSHPDHPIQGGGYLMADLDHLAGVNLAGCYYPGMFARRTLLAACSLLAPRV